MSMRAPLACILAAAVAAWAGLGAPAWCAQVPNPVNAPTSIAHAGDALIASGTSPQQAADSGISLTSQTPNAVLAGPASGMAGAPTFRALVSADMPGSGAGAGSVTSVGLSLPGFITVSGSPVTGSGTLTGTLANQSANRVFAGPTSGGAAAPTFRALVSSDLPTIVLESKTVAGLPTCNAGAKGTLYWVTDATAPSWNAALTGGGAVGVIGACDGSAWTAH
jgi:hypothetical protein